MKINKKLACLIGLLLIACGYSISFIFPVYHKLELKVPTKTESRNFYIYIKFNRTRVPPPFILANIVKEKLSELPKPYQKATIDSLFKFDVSVAYIDSNKCGVYLMNSDVYEKGICFQDFFITPDTIYLIDNYRPVLYKYIVENNKGGFDTLDTRP
jgi:hypothetical protein